MASNYSFETRDERIERMKADNPGRSIEVCTAVVDGIWKNTSEINSSRIPKRFIEASVEDLGYQKKRLLNAVGELFADPEENKVVGLIFTGPAGSGKTYAAYSLINKINEQNPEMIAYTVDYPQAFSDLRSEFLDGSHNFMGSVWDRLSNVSDGYGGVLLLDDVSSKKPTDFELDKLMMLLERRFNYYMPFIITTNVKPEDFKKVFGERLASRLLGYCKIIEFEGDKRIIEDKTS